MDGEHDLVILVADKSNELLEVPPIMAVIRNEQAYVNFVAINCC